MKLIPLNRSVKRGIPGCLHTWIFQVVDYALVDDHWFDRLTVMGMWMLWNNKKTGLQYAWLQGTVPKVFMHQVVFGNKWPDHKDGNGLNNQESNLRPATRSQQAANRKLRRTSTSGEPGVSWHGGNRKWLVYVKQHGKRVFSKYFSDKGEAIRVAREQRVLFHGEFVRQVAN